LFLFITLTINGCSAFKQAEGTQPDYKELKQMVIDILQTEDGKKAIQESLNDPTIKKKMIFEEGEVKQIIQTELLSAENQTELKKMFEDPKFASKLGKTLKQENEKLLKDLMKDPEYRAMMLEIMQDQAFEKMILDLMKSTTYRKQMMTVMKESFESPMFKEDLLKLMEKANEEAMKPEKEQKKDKKQQEEGAGGQQSE